ncbi:MAG: L-serine ammonia-lyase, iron-sulfur-dependent, subunit alpha [Eubacteriales bacterium]|nr:L-serine ammonia-lyase, iron-sulfur-dependent, subunit alpha [Eubacteriales bacterium]
MFESLAEICTYCKEKDVDFFKAILDDDCRENGRTEEASLNQMRAILTAMKESVENYDPELFSSSGLVGTEAEKLRKAKVSGKLISGDFISDVMEKALKVSESNACMKRIVAAPTAGSCGVVPAVLITYQEYYNCSDEDMIKSIYVSAGIGEIIAKRASIAGAAGGCQAEIGSASAMAAGALTYLRGGSAEDICNSAALALKNLLGLACDPVAGLVEVPCVKRNVMGSVNAVTSSDLTASGIYSKIPPDEVIDAMKAIGKNMSDTIKETANGGLAATPTGEKIKESISI